MATFKTVKNEIPALRFIADRMQLLSGPGRRMLDDFPWLMDSLAIERELEETSVAMETLELFPEETERIRLCLMQVRDIRTTISRLLEGTTLDDVDLFELKNFAITAVEMREIIRSVALVDTSLAEMPKLDEVVKLLDPEATGSRHFYIYDAYSAELAAKRKELKKLQAQPDYDETLSDSLTAECFRLEADVRGRLSEKLKEWARDVAAALEFAGRCDLLLAKAGLTRDLGLCRPECSEEGITFVGLRNPVVEARLEKENKKFQPVDLKLQPGVTLITGINMGGKSVTMRSVALAQAMMQFGFYVAAGDATICPVESIVASMGDADREDAGLSSFGTEIMKISSIIESAREGRKMLVLIDEPARTTNPEEGRAIAEALVEILNRTDSFCMISTHYTGVAGAKRKLRVKGLREDIAVGGGVSPAMMSDFVDYSLIEETDAEVPHEALRIASLLGVDGELVELAGKRL